jgi:hypothetical protein
MRGCSCLILRTLDKGGIARFYPLPYPRCLRSSPLSSHHLPAIQTARALHWPPLLPVASWHPKIHLALKLRSKKIIECYFQTDSRHFTSLQPSGHKADAMTSTTKQPSTIPIVGLGPFIYGDTASQKEVAQQLDDAFRNVGFVYLLDHGVPQDLVDECFEWVCSARSLLPHPIFFFTSVAGINVEVVCTDLVTIEQEILRPPHVREDESTTSSRRLAPPRILCARRRESEPACV